MPNRIEQDIKVVFWGTLGEFSYHVLERLLDVALDICAVVTLAPSTSADRLPIVRLAPNPSTSELPIRRPYLRPNISHLAWENGIPVFELRRLDAAEVIQQLELLNADVAIVACFPRLIPYQILTIPQHGFLNLHPSLLPDLRGPYPLFWSFRLGQGYTGVTIHHMDETFDTGDIAMQRKILLPDGISGPEADALLAAHGASLLHTATRQIGSGTIARIPQPAGGSCFSRPTGHDFHIPTSWSARHAFNFICGTAEWGQPYRIIGQDFDLSLRRAISFDATALQSEPLQRDGRLCRIQFASGILYAQ